MIKRRHTRQVDVGGVLIGGGAPVVVQSMTNTVTEDVAATIQQVAELAQAGSELVRITVNTEAAAQAVPEIRAGLDALGLTVPLIGDFHFNGHRLLEQYPECAKALAKYRINPGNVGSGEKRDQQFSTMVKTACRYDKPVRIGVNWGSLDKQLVAHMMDKNAASPTPKSSSDLTRDVMVTSALESAQRAQEIGLPAERILLSCKMSGVQDLIGVYRQLADSCDYALHLGLTEAGMGLKGTIASVTALAVLLQKGIGDTIRISLTPQPDEPRTREVEVAQRLLQSLELRAFVPQVIACPGCGRTTSSYFQKLAQRIESHLHAQMPQWCRRYPGVENMHVAVMGCIVNGPGESRQANIGISLPGTGEQSSAPVYADGEKIATLRGNGNTIAEEFIGLVDNYVQQHYG